jgi:hypothetical protein
MLKRSILWAASAVLALSSACSSTVVLPHDTSSTGGSGGTSSTGGSGGSAGSGGFAGSGGSGGSGGSTTWDPTTSKDCQPWVDRTSIASETLRFVNQTGQTIYLPTLCDGRISFSLTSPNSPQSYSNVYDTSCLQTCQMLQTEAPYACGVCMPTAIRLNPGETHDFVWDGLALEGTLMEPDCFATPTSGGTCEMKQLAPQGSYTATGTAYTGCQGSCSCDAQGTCAGTPSGTPVEATQTFSFPSAGVVEVVFGFG